MYELTSVKTIKDIAARFGFQFKKGLGQNFLTDKNVLIDIVNATQIKGGVLEIGPGFGVLTQELAQVADKVVSIELDRALFPILEHTLADFDTVKLVYGDVMKLNLKKLLEDEFSGERISVAANLPYYITTPIIAMLIESKLPIDNIVVMVQKEVAQRICASPGKKDYGAISVMCQYYTNPEIVTVVPAGVFVPAPKVDSAVLKLAVCDKPNVEVSDEALFFRVVRASFAQRRKTLLNCLSSGGFNKSREDISNGLQKLGISPTVRGETLGLKEFAAITKWFAKENS